MLSRKAYAIAEEYRSEMDGYTNSDFILDEKAQYSIVCTFETDPVTKELAPFFRVKKI